MLQSLALSLLLLQLSAFAFQPRCSSSSKSFSLSRLFNDLTSGNEVGSIISTSKSSEEVESPLVQSFNIFLQGMKTGDGFKQSLADALAGPELDLAAANAKISSLISSAPCVIFSWSVSPFSTKAKKYLDDIGVKYTAVELDRPWSEGNPIRAALGRRVGRTSVPAIFIGGKYVGGCEDGPSAECPGIVKLAFQGRLRPMLIEAKALDADAHVDFAPSYARRAIMSECSSETEETGQHSNQHSHSDSDAKGENGGETKTVVALRGVEPFVDESQLPEFEDNCPSDTDCEIP
jgi:glutaredoxin